MNQARSFYANIQIENIDNLINAGWYIRPNMHFSFRASNLVWTDTKIDIKKYIDYWCKNLSNLGQVSRNDFQSYCDNLELNEMISSDNWTDIESKIIKTSMQKINICPGIHFSYKWQQKEAISLDKGDVFVNIVKQKIYEAKGLWESNKVNNS